MPGFFYLGDHGGRMDWAKNVFVRGAKLYEVVLEGMWEKGEEDALAISSLLQDKGLDACRVLDVPCGIGRVGIPLAQLGFSVTGVDFSPHLVAVANSKVRGRKMDGKASFVTGTMSDLDSRLEQGAFDCAINVFTSIGYGSEQDDLDFFKSLRKVVKKGGLFVISGLRNRDYIVGHPAQNIYEESKNLLVLDRYTFDLVRSRERGTWRFYLKVKDAMKLAGEFPTDIRVYSPHELVAMLGSSGWSVSEVYESLSTMRDFTPESPVYAMVAEAV
jgi:SAM-dependent methyltransferase